MKSSFLSIFSLFIFLLFLASCEKQKEIVFKLDSLKQKEIKIFYGVSGYPELTEDVNGNLIIELDTMTSFYTATPFTKIKSFKNVYCFRDKLDKCFFEESDLRKEGFTINLYSNFSSDKKTNYINPFDKIIIEKIK